MSMIAFAILVLLALAGVSGYLGFRRDLGTGPAGRLGLVLLGFGPINPLVRRGQA